MKRMCATFGIDQKHTCRSKKCLNLGGISASLSYQHTMSILVPTSRQHFTLTALPAEGSNTPYVPVSAHSFSAPTLKFGSGHNFG
eukprot:492744-Pelagomonas_calceolata.AAC.2